MGSQTIPSTMSTTTLYVWILISSVQCCDPTEFSGSSATKLVRVSDSSVVFGCEEGYELYGPRIVYCRDKSWDSKVPVCVRPGCEEGLVNKVDNGQAYRMIGGGVYRYKCWEGYYLLGSDTIYCDGQDWSSNVPTCAGPPCSFSFHVPEPQAFHD